jgi:hypothetical protein
LGGAILTPELKNYVTAGIININNSLDDDLIAPDTPQRFTIRSAHASSLELEWAKSADQGKETSAFKYEIRRSEHPIQSEEQWSSAKPLEFKMNKDSELAISATVDLSAINTSGYLAIRAVDRAGNFSKIADSIPYSSRKVTEAFRNKGNTLEGLSIKGKWGLEEITGYGRVISDSPGGNYGFGETTSLALPEIKISTTDMALILTTKFDFEIGYDFGFLEIKTNTSSWKTIATYNGSLPWKQLTYSLKDYLTADDKTFQVRLRVTSDATSSVDGLYLSDIAIVK